MEIKPKVNSTVWFNGNVPLQRRVCSVKQESQPITKARGKLGKEEKSQKLSLNSSRKCFTLTEKLKTSGGLRGSICSWLREPIFKRSPALQEKTCFAMAKFSNTPPLSITTFWRGFLRAHHIEQGQALLYTAHPEMEPLWVAECILIPSH